MMQVSIVLPEKLLEELTALAEVERRSREAIVCDAVSAYIASHKRTTEADVFGAWKHRQVDALEP